ncbi:MAG: type VII secretion integral membrane protein EccD [Gordonia sp.]|nr:type VII secretion integral membrane protein EccD [Gordonia sp. (in: high G+C Gram-positive bacteria)]
MTAADLLAELDAAAATEPALARVSVIGGTTQFDVGLPAAVPVAALIPDLVSLISSRTPNVEDAEARPVPIRDHWTLARVGREPIAPGRTLSEAGVRDGDLLILRSVPARESAVLFDDVIDAVARLGEAQFASWSAFAARVMGYVVAVAASVLFALALLRERSEYESWWPPVIAALVTLAYVVAGAVIGRYYLDGTTAAISSLCAVPCALATGMMLPPGPFGAPHLTLACAVAVVVAAMSYRISTAGPLVHAAVITAALFGAGAGAVQMLWSPDHAGTGALLCAVAILAISFASRITILLARLPLPPVPTAGAAIDPADSAPRPAIEGIGAIGAMALPSAAALEQRTRTAGRYLTGLIIGTATAAVAGIALVAYPAPEFSWRGTLFATIIAIVLCLRGRSHTDLAQASVLIGAGSFGWAVVCVEVAFGPGDHTVLAAVALGGTAMIALVCGVLAPHSDFSPVMRRMVEIFEYLLIAAIVPLLFWILDLYAAVRDL